jgi:hypothetical protein
MPRFNETDHKYSRVRREPRRRMTEGVCVCVCVLCVLCVLVALHLLLMLFVLFGWVLFAQLGAGCGEERKCLKNDDTGAFVNSGSKPMCTSPSNDLEGTPDMRCPDFLCFLAFCLRPVESVGALILLAWTGRVVWFDACASSLQVGDQVDARDLVTEQIAVIGMWDAGRLCLCVCETICSRVDVLKRVQI